jgi:hypothetical protein
MSGVTAIQEIVDSRTNFEPVDNLDLASQVNDGIARCGRLEAGLRHTVLSVDEPTP